MGKRVQASRISTNILRTVTSRSGVAADLLPELRCQGGKRRQSRRSRGWPSGGLKASYRQFYRHLTTYFVRFSQSK